MDDYIATNILEDYENYDFAALKFPKSKILKNCF